MNPVVLMACVPVLCASAFGDVKPGAKQDASVDAVDVRVMLSSPGSLVIDRGSADLVAVGDVVVLHPKDGSTPRGAVSKVNDRTAAVKLEDRSLQVPIGTRGEVQVPKSRRPGAKPAPADPKKSEPKKVEPKKADVPTTTKKATPAPAGKSPADEKKPPAKPPTSESETTTAHDAWPNPDKDWSKGMPLLTDIPPIRPEARTPTITGHADSSFEYVRAANGGSSNSYIRAGGDVTAENLFGDGGTLRASGEIYHRAEEDGGHGIGVQPYELSYTWGGTRFGATRLEVGRFLQDGMPEFGILDGAEYSRRLEDGSSIGASIGFMPELDDDFTSFNDFQLAAYYHWVADDSERFSATGGLQTTWHDSDHDRDLLVARMRWSPDRDLDFHGTMWVDFYHSNDRDKNSAVEITQALLVLAKRFDSNSGGDLTFRHLLFPDIERSGEFTPITPAEIEDNHLDELSGSAFETTESHKRIHGQAGVWDDEDDAGGSADAGIEFPEVFFHDLKTDFTVFGSKGDFTTIYGGRITCSLPADDGRWDVTYEYANHRLHGFSSELDDLVQQRLYLSRHFRWRGGWSFSLNAQATWWDTDVSWSAGWFVQKSF